MPTANCYEYATDIYGHSQPGDGINNLSCSSLVENITKDGNRSIACDTECKYYEYKIMTFIARKIDFHLYRQEDDGTWTHKFRNKYPSNLDASNNVIKDPLLADRCYYNYIDYSKLCGCFCINKYRR